MKNQIITFLLFVSVVSFCLALDQNKKNQNPWDGNRTVPVHKIPLKDEFDQIIVPNREYALPFSSRNTCAPCHDYSTIEKGLHFNTSSQNKSKHPREPWIWLDQKTGTVLPLSYYDGKGIWNPSDLDISPWEFTLLFGRHMTGGGINEPDENRVSPDSRWNVSGKIEINCMACHNLSPKQSHTEWALQILRQNFRWAATASSGLGEVKGMASRLPETWDIYDGPNPDDTEWAVVPSVDYNPQDFDKKHRIYMNISHQPDNQRCLVCHSVSPVNKEQHMSINDVHLSAGLKCVDCHRNGLDHNMIQGYDKEADDYKEPEIHAFSCAGCHIGKDRRKNLNADAGRFGAPYPTHNGIPAVHFEKLSCTVCHSGSLPGDKITKVRTSRANRLGIYGMAQWHTERPYIFEPIYKRNKHGKIVPCRLVWPSFWGFIHEKQIKPLTPSDILSNSGNILKVDETAAQILLVLSNVPEIEGTPVLFSSGKAYQLNLDDGLDRIPSDSIKTSEPTQINLWALKKGNEIFPLVPDFNPDSEEEAYELEIKIQLILEALGLIKNAPGTPVLLIEQTKYQIIQGYLEQRNWEGEIVESPELRWLLEEKAVPLLDDFHIRTITATVGEQETLTEEQVEKVLKELEFSNKSSHSEKDYNYFYISSGKMFILDDEGKLTATNHPAAEPVTWPIGHQVRPSTKALGINECSDCHSVDSSFFFNKIKGSGPLKTDQSRVLSHTSFMNLNKSYQKIFGLSFTVRPVIKTIIFISLFIIVIIVLAVVINQILRYAGLRK
ncbi:MAG: hypothetical protein ACOC6P_03000 [Candidatus Aminicenantaceae bacterium]